ncbi:MAG TPA: hypothetical protein VGZ29_13530 [Terriglobia bacterium]|nr:hypothetical protein [Terriglobia bacterium]
MNSKKRARAALTVGFIGLCTLLEAVRFEGLQRWYGAQLLVSGVCIGVAIGVVLWQRKPTA